MGVCGVRVCVWVCVGVWVCELCVEVFNIFGTGKIFKCPNLNSKGIKIQTFKDLAGPRNVQKNFENKFEHCTNNFSIEIKRK